MAKRKLPPAFLKNEKKMKAKEGSPAEERGESKKKERGEKKRGED